MSVFEFVNTLSAEAVLSRIELPLANDGKTYVCPICGNGTKGNPRQGHGIGIKPRITAKGQVRWKCFSCDKDFSNFDLVAATLGLDAERDTAESARRVAELFGLEESKESFSFPREKFSEQRLVTTESKEGAIELDEKKSAAAAPKNYAKFYEFCQSNVDKFLAERGGEYRGLTVETFKRYGLGYHPEFRLGEGEKSPHLIIPYDSTYYYARAIDGASKSHHGAPTGLYEPMTIKTESEGVSCAVNFIVEGEIDALSIAQDCSIVDNMIGCVATGGVTRWKEVVPWLDKRFGDLDRKPKFIVKFDDDKGGRTNSKELVQVLKAAGYPAEISFFKGKKDANDLLQQGKGELFGQLIDDIDETSNRLVAQSEEMMKSAELARQAKLNRSVMNIFSLADYFGKDFRNDIDLARKYSERKTGFKNLDAAAQMFLPGLYVLGALPATGKTTFAWQLLNQLADNGETCIYCSYEMSRAELFTKSLARELYKINPKKIEELNLTSANIRRGRGESLEELKSLTESFAKSKKTLYVAELSNMGIADLIEKLKSLIANADKSPVICIDYLQIVPPSKDAKTTTTKEKIDDVILRLKDFQRETNSTLIVISSFNRDSYYQDVSFASFKESGAIEYSADVIWGLQNYGVNYDGKPDKDEMIAESKKPERVIKLACLKNRNGSVYTCYFRYLAAYDYFKPMGEPNQEPKQERPTHKR